MFNYIVYLNNNLIPETEANISIWDRGFTLGDAVYDTLRTFRHQLYRVNAHISRLYSSLRYVYIDPGIPPAGLVKIITTTLEANLPAIDNADDMSLIVRVTRGVPGAGATLLVTCRPIDFSRFAHFYNHGLELVTPTVRAVSPDTLDPRVKTQSRIVNVLAEIQADAARPGAWPLFCNNRGIITESARANFMIVQGGRVLTPKGGRVLAGVTAATTVEVAEKMGYQVEERDLTPYDVFQADEAIVTASSICVLPVKSLNGVPINGGTVPGPVTAALMDGWRDLSGVDFVRQALTFSKR
ncbi:MAG: aminotransferase class IV [Anaerolineales bacterium]|nr:aminotransferase class IV [Anaerolineales bacterium]